MPSSLGPAEILVILFVALIVLGPNRLPEAGRQVGKALAEVRRWSRDMKSEVRGFIDPELMSSRAPVPGAVPAATTPSPAAAPADVPLVSSQPSVELSPPAPADPAPPPATSDDRPA